MLVLLGALAPLALTRRGVLAATAAAAATRPGRDVFLYEDVTSDTCLRLTRDLLEDDDVVRLHVQSGGGALTSALHVCDVVESRGNVHSYVEGTVASAASLITVAADRRLMSKRSVLLLHQPTLDMGELRYDMMTDRTYNVGLLYDVMIDLYVAHSRLQRKQVEEIVATERYLTAAEAKRHGLVDEIV